METGAAFWTNRTVDLTTDVLAIVDAFEYTFAGNGIYDIVPCRVDNYFPGASYFRADPVPAVAGGGCRVRTFVAGADWHEAHRQDDDC